MLTSCGAFQADNAFLAGLTVISSETDDLELLPILQVSIARQQADCYRCEAADRSCIVNAERLWDEHESSQGLGTMVNFLEESPKETLGA